MKSTTKLVLSALLNEVNERNKGNQYSDVRSVTKSGGLVPTEDFFEFARTSKDTSNYKVVRPGMFVYNPARINIGSIAISNEKTPVIVSPMYVVFEIDTTALVPSYLEAFLTSTYAVSQISQNTEEGARFRFPFSNFSKLEIDLPSIDEQHEILNYLQIFRELIEQLRLEIIARRKQYNFYRDSLLLFSDDVDTRWLPFGEVANIFRGASPRPIQNFLVEKEKGTPWIKIGDVGQNEKYVISTSQYVSSEGVKKSRQVHPGDFILTNSMSFGRPYISKIYGCVHDGWLVISDFSSDLDSNYLYHLLGSDFIQREFQRRVGDGSIKNLNAEIVRSVVLPIPSLGIQVQVAKHLDKFESLLTDIHDGLPAELAARRKQYEYYRDKLLTLNESAA